MNRLLSPGALIPGHKKLEATQCLACHELNQGVPDPKCLACHQAIGADQAAKKGFHGMAEGSCISCHSDHKGREFDSTKVDQKNFQHELTGYSLTGKHAQLRCSDCHQATRASKMVRKNDLDFHGLTTSCAGCHSKEDPHRFTGPFRGKDCSSCHGMDAWKVASFDHKRAGFALEGKHAELKCASCHKGVVPGKRVPFSGLAKDCLSCHKDPHGFPEVSSQRLGRLQNCQLCHNSHRWASDFNHNKDTNFPILGKHQTLKCSACHKENPASPSKRQYHWKNLERNNCASCHQSPHLSSFSKENLARKCTDCHSEEKWAATKNLNFHHDSSTRFPLDGRHKELACASCHKQGKEEVYRFEGAGEKFCASCHKSPHEGQFGSATTGRACFECHGTKSFQEHLPFQHAQTRFPLTGKHRNLQCAECHKETGEKFTQRPFRSKHQFTFPSPGRAFCVDCHANVHERQFHGGGARAANCLECHSTDTFSKRLPFGHESTGFPLRGKHREARCELCHQATAEKFPGLKRPMGNYHIGARTEDCSACHKDIHKGSYGPHCASCHKETGWKQTPEFHKNFPLEGVHFSLSCRECHADHRKLSGTGETCQICHQKDDIHNGSLPNCSSCHKQVFWENTSFRHGLTRFALRGIHRTLDCYSCHSNGVYQGLPNQCVDCHRSQALSFTGSPNHSSLLNRSCTECHNQFSFH